MEDNVCEVVEVIPAKVEIMKDEKGRFLPGHCPNRSGGRKAMPKEFRELAMNHSIEALGVCIEIMRDDRRKAQDRLAAINIILNRSFGLPTQIITGGEDEAGMAKPVTMEHIIRLLGGDKKE